VAENNDDRRVAIACQGGGSHTAFTAGVLKKLLKEKVEGKHDYEVVALSGTSGGAICALLAWYGFLINDAKRAIELMDNLSILAAVDYSRAGYPVDAGAALVVELDGSEAECESRFEQVVDICERAGANSIRVARDEAEREVIWKARKAAFAAMGRVAPNYYVQDSVIPRTRLAEVLGRIDELGRE
jgi:FAD/FMN-containing dehydrogenase